MESTNYEAFWSYAHSDNQRTNGRVLDLAKAIQDEIALTTAVEMDLFVDRTEIDWGELWRDRIDNAIGETPFFIAIVTPKFLASVECRRELLAFSRESKSRGVDKLLLPIVYVDIPDLDESSSDEVVALIAKTQWVDWSALRLLAQDDPRVLAAVSYLGSRIVALRKESEGAAKRFETKSETDNVETLHEVITEINTRLDTWMESVEFDNVAGATWRVAINERFGRISRLQSRPGQGGAIISIYHKLGQDLLPIAQRRLLAAQSFSKLTIELDPYVAQALRLVAEHPQFTSLLEGLSDGVSEARRNIQLTEGEHGYEFPHSAVNFSTLLRETNATMTRSMTFVEEANEIVLTWIEKLQAQGLLTVA
jgi:hypothetical protein